MKNRNKKNNNSVNNNYPCRTEDDLKIILVGDESLIENKITSTYKKRVEIVHTDEFIKMDEDLVHAIRNKKKSSMRLAVNCVKEAKAQACVSAGNTGALMSISKIILKTINGIDRPAICTSLPTKKNLNLWKLLLLKTERSGRCYTSN